MNAPPIQIRPKPRDPQRERTVETAAGHEAPLLPCRAHYDVMGLVVEPVPGPPLRVIIFPRLDLEQPPALEGITAAEAALELLRYSKNLHAMPRHGLDLVPALLSQVHCRVLRRDDDLAGAANLVLALVARAPLPARETAEGRRRARQRKHG